MVGFDERAGIIRSRVCGSMAPDEARVFMAELAQAIKIAQARTGKALHLCDARAASLQLSTTNEIFSHSSLKADRVALLLSSTLLKLQSQRLHGTDGIAAFVDETSALDWLTRDRETIPEQA